MPPILLAKTKCVVTHSPGAWEIPIMAKRRARRIVPKVHSEHTFESARRLRGPFVYGLVDGDGLFYIGKTIDAAQRFYRYHRQTSNPKLRRRLKDSGDAVRVIVLEHNPIDLSLAERRHIEANRDRVLNISFNERRMRSKLELKLTPGQKDMVSCAICEGRNFFNGKHRCKGEQVEVLNPVAPPIIQAIMVEAGILREPDASMQAPIS